MKKFLQSLITFTLCYAVYLFGFNTYARASVINTVAPIHIVKQAKTNWCWAASAEMFGKSVYDSSTRDQYDIVKYIKGSEVNATATVSECLTACQYSSYYTKSLDYTYRLSFSEVGRRVAKGQGIFTALKKDGTNMGHVVVVSATQFIDGNNGIENNIDYLDPFYGKSYHCSYDEFYNGNYNGLKVLCMIYTK